MAFVFGPYTLDAEQASLKRDGQPVPVQPKVLDLLAFLVERPGAIVTRQELARRLWPGVFVGEDALHQLLRKARRALEDDAETPRWIEAVPRRGWRFVGAVDPVGAVGNGGDRGTVGRLARERPDPLLGRADVLAEARRRLETGATVVLRGPGGAGKTRLVRELVGGRATAWCDLRNDRTAEDVCRNLAGVLAVPLDALPAARQSAHLAGVLARRGMVLVLDGAEAVADVLPPLLREWGGATPTVVTTRVAVDTGDVLHVGALAPADARTLFLHRAALARGRPLTAEECTPVAAILAHLDGLPLAIELAASRLRVLAVDDLASRGPGGALRHALEASWSLLTVQNRAVLAACSIFPGSFRVGDVEALLDGECEEPLARLADSSLVHGVAPDLALLDTVRAFAADKLAQSGEEPSVVDAWSALLLRRTGALLPGFFRWEAPALLALAAHREPLVVHLRRSDLAPAQRVGLACALAAAVRYTGPWLLAREALEHAVGDYAADGPVRADTWALLGEYRIRTGAAEIGVEALDVALADPAASDTIGAYASFLRARVRHATGDAAGALADATTAIARGESAGNDALVAFGNDAAGLATAALGDEAGMRRHYLAATARASSPALRGVHGMVAQNFAACLGRYGRHDEALVQFRAALDGILALPFPHLRATALGNLGAALVQAGRGREAVGALRQALELAAEIGDRPSERQHAGNLGEVLVEVGEVDEAERWLDRAMELTAGDDPAGQSDGLRRKAVLAQARGELDLAEARISEAIAAARGANPTCLGVALAWGGAIARARGFDAASRFAEATSVLGGDHPLLIRLTVG